MFAHHMFAHHRCSLPALAATLVALSVLGPLEARAAESTKGGLLYVAFVGGQDPRTARLVEVLEQEVFVAAQLVLSTGGAVYRDVTSRRRIELERGSVLDSLLEFQQYVSLGMRDEVNRIRGQLRLAVTDFLVIKVLPTDGDAIRVDMELRSLEDWRLVQMKTVGACPMPVAAVSAQVRSVISDVVAGRPDRTARIVATATPQSPVRLGTSVRLDGCESLDPDWDTLEWKWKTLQAPAGADPLPEAGFVGTRFEFTPRTSGRYELELTVARVLDGRIAEPSRVRIDVVRPPWADAGPSRVFESVGTRLNLDTSRSGPEPGPDDSTRFSWRQTQGATVALEPDGNAGRSWSFVAHEAGVFSFELTVENEVGTATDVVTYLVAPPPVADPGPDLEAHPHHSVRLNGRGSFDGIDPSPVYSWTLEEPSDAAHISGAHSSMPTFVATEEGTYRVRLLVRARRKLDDEERWALASKVLTIEVVRPSLTLYANATTTMRFRGDGLPHPSDGRKAHSYLLGGVGLTYAPPWLPDWLAVSFTQGIVRMRLDPVGYDPSSTDNPSREPEFSGGGSFGPLFRWRGETLSAGVLVATLFNIGAALRTGVTAAGLLQWRIVGGLVLEVEVGYDGYLSFTESLEEEAWIHGVRGTLAFGLEI